MCRNLPAGFTILGCVLLAGLGGTFGSVHKTKDASEKIADLWCYKCDTIYDGDKCVRVNGNLTHSLNFHHKCNSDQRICKVNKVLVTLSGGHSVGKQKLWTLQRNCSKSCDEGCITIGERTKVHSCTSCCERDLCNVGNLGDKTVQLDSYIFVLNSIGIVFLYKK